MHVMHGDFNSSESPIHGGAGSDELRRSSALAGGNIVNKLRSLQFYKCSLRNRSRIESVKLFKYIWGKVLVTYQPVCESGTQHSRYGINGNAVRCVSATAIHTCMKPAFLARSIGRIFWSWRLFISVLQACKRCWRTGIRCFRALMRPSWRT